MEDLKITAPHGVSNLFGQLPVLVQRHTEFLRIRQDQVQLLIRLHREVGRGVECYLEELSIRTHFVSPEVARQLEQEEIGRIPPRFIRHRQMEGFVADLEMLPDQVTNLPLESRESLSRPLHAMAPLGS